MARARFGKIWYWLGAAALYSIALYAYGNESPYRYHFLTPEYSSGQTSVMSLDDGNKIKAGSSTYILDKNQIQLFDGSDLVQGGSITGTGPFTLSKTQGLVDMPLPDKFLGTAFVIPHIAFTHYYYLLSPNNDTTVTITIGALVDNVSLPKGQVVMYPAGGDSTVSGRIIAQEPIKVFYRTIISTGDDYSLIPVPPASTELVGIPLGNVPIVGVLEDGTTITVYASDGTSTTVAGLAAGSRPIFDIGRTPPRSALRIVSDKPIAAFTMAPFWLDGSSYYQPQYMATYHGIPVDAQYVYVVCLQNTTVKLFDGSGGVVTNSCTSDGTFPGQVHFDSTTIGANILGGSYIESDRPVYAIFGDATSSREQNLLGYSHRYFSLLTYPGLSELVSYSDNNTIHVGGVRYDLNSNDRISISDIASGTEIIGTGAFTLASNVAATEPPLSEDFAGTLFAVPHERYSHKYFLLSPYGSATADITIGTVTTTVNLPQGQVVGYDAGSVNGIAATIKSDRPILLSHQALTSATAFWDTFPVLPASTELWGLFGSGARVSAVYDNTNISVYRSDGTYESHVINAGQIAFINGGQLQGTGPGIHIVADKPVGAIQIADGDGGDATSAFPEHLLKRYYVIPVDTQYIAVVCPFANTTVKFMDGATVQNRACYGDGTTPGKLYFGSSTNGININAGASLESNQPIYVIFENAASDGEQNIFGTNLTPATAVPPVP